MADRPHWFAGATGSGKTSWLLHQLGSVSSAAPGQSPLVFAANGDNRLRLATRLGDNVPGVAVVTTTPNGFIQDEVTLFWPLLVAELGLFPQFPLRLRPENEQDLATRHWQPQLLDGTLTVEGWLETQFVRRSLDFLQMAAAAGIEVEDLPVLLPEGIPSRYAPEVVWQAIGKALVDWRDWCLDRGLLTYGVMTELYWRHLLPHPLYQEKLLARYNGVFVDDLDEYPAIAAQWLQIFIDRGRPVAITWNSHGQVRMGLGADPNALEQLKGQCQVIDAASPAAASLAHRWGDQVVEWVMDPLALTQPLACFETLQTGSRGELLRKTAERVAEAVEKRQVAPQDIAIIGPGLDAIARYTLATILTNRGLPVASLSDQRPVIHSPLVRALLTLLIFVYPGLGRLASTEDVAEMLVVLSQIPQAPEVAPWFESVQIDPVRAELLVDHCFEPNLDRPELLPVERFERWDRLGHKATAAYGQLRQWIEHQRQQRQQRLTLGVVSVLDRAIQTFLWGGSHLPPDQLAALRELLETAQHYWAVEERLLQVEPILTPTATKSLQTSLERFILLLRQGTVTANPYPVEPDQVITVATVYQYRLQRLRHRWHFWIDAGSPRWLGGTENLLFGYPLFLASYTGRPWTTGDLEMLHRDRPERILRDLLGRVSDRVVLCHSELAVSGQEQIGPLLSLVTANATD
ncbi:hypothetical protein IQ254_01095 [Nodosilinea sp. LEGE 07088]|uniref:hypothetical protein n=1 Tax=Nodosilinea sp. LEGE 07088 TaxID=2777968 RepID=UPI00187F431E|nr:hypothetical protein [Nodosilinea sp. LEGE 07088]MBE9135813.1 hypothetical protein [Nodosilinea sp. LEGE 07088]